MRRAMLSIAAACVALPAAAQELRSAWVQYGPGGRTEVRAVVAGEACPAVTMDGVARRMDLRAPATAAFPSVCSAALPPGVKRLAIGGRSLPAPAADPRRILLVGDTGCRIKGATVQACNDPHKWPFARMAREAARLRPDLVIDVGDYLYRESACPAGDRACEGTPHGDNWPAWYADFFAPAAPLLAAAPWVLVRGNHEDCDRAGAGWLRLMGPNSFAPAAPCAPHLDPYTVPAGSVSFVVMDDADAPDTRVAADLVATHEREFAALAAAPAPAWLLMHRPVWGAIAGPLDVPIGGNRTLIAAVGRAGIPRPVELMLSGHIHSFEILNYGGAPRVPPQLIAGFGGDKLDRAPRVLGGTIFQGESGVVVTDGLSMPGFGFVMMVKRANGWAVEVHDVHGRIERRCWFRAGRLGCAPRR